MILGRALNPSQLPPIADNLSTGSLCQLIAYAMVIPAGPFPLTCIAFTIAGFGISIQNAHCNGFVATSGGNIATKIGILHATYGT